MQEQLNAYTDYVANYVDGYIGGLFKEGIINEIEAEKLKTYFSNPDVYQEELTSIAEYFYIRNGEVRQLFELVEVLPQLNYHLEVFDRKASTDKLIKQLNKGLHKIKHKTLTRDLLKQNATTGNLVGIFLGEKPNIYPFIFNDLRYVFPIGRNYRGEWMCTLDLAWFDTMSELESEFYFMNLKPFITKTMYEAYCKDNTKRYIHLPYERTFCLRTGTTKRNQAIGTNWATSGLFDVLHKKKLKDVEQSVANKIINAVAVLTIGSEKNYELYANAKLNKGVKMKIHSGVKSALEKNHSGGVSVVTIPEYAKLEFPDVDTDGLDGNKFDKIDSDIKSSFGMSGAMTNGEGTNFATAKINLDIFYKRIGVMLEQIETEVYQRYINLNVPEKEKDNIYMIYDKEMPLTLKERIDYLSKLNDKGWSSKHLIEALGLDFETYWQQTVYETDSLKVQEKLMPPKTAHTMGNEEDGNGRESISDSDVENENTIKSKQSDGNASKK